jgi:hypothetical protein
MTPLLSGRRGRGGGWYRQRTATTPTPSLPRRGIIFIAGGEPKNHELFARNDGLFEERCRDEVGEKVLDFLRTISLDYIKSFGNIAISYHFAFEGSGRVLFL